MTSQSIRKYLRAETLPTPFCPGCGHGILMGTILRAIDEYGIDLKSMLFVSGIGCAAWIPSPHFRADTLHTTHGRPIAFATGAKLFKPELKVMVISGDGDLAAIGGNHLIHAARRDIEITVICSNNQIYGMTGGQSSPTTTPDSITTTTPKGNSEPAFDLCKLVAAAGASLVARYVVTQNRLLINVIKKAMSNNGFSFIEVVSACPVHYGKMNMCEEPSKLLKDIEERCISISQVQGLSDKELTGKIITGEFINECEAS